jgi:integrase
MFGKAVRAGVVPANPVRALEKSERPKPSSGDKRILAETEIQAILGNAGKFRPLVAVGIFTGVRLGEALGLTWADVDYDAGVIRVRKQLGRDRARADLKTNRARRNVVLVPELARLLKAHWMASPHKQPGDFVFAAPDRRGRDHRSTSRGIERACERAKLDGVSFHSFRHTFASWLISGAKEDVETVSRQLGHANATVTLRVYSHEFDAERSADALRTKLSASLGRHLRAVND